MNFHPVVNAPEPTRIAGDVCAAMVGEGNVARNQPAGTGSEDFSFMAEVVPACYLHVGNGADSRPVHNPHYDFNDAAIPYGASFFVRIAEEVLSP